VDYFRVTPPSVHQMILTLEKRGSSPAFPARRVRSSCSFLRRRFLCWMMRSPCRTAGRVEHESQIPVGSRTGEATSDEDQRSVGGETRDPHDRSGLVSGLEDEQVGAVDAVGNQLAGSSPLPVLSMRHDDGGSQIEVCVIDPVHIHHQDPLPSVSFADLIPRHPSGGWSGRLTNACPLSCRRDRGSTGGPQSSERSILAIAR
jgi:hypothetical protein